MTDKTKDERTVEENSRGKQSMKTVEENSRGKQSRKTVEENRKTVE